MRVCPYPTSCSMEIRNQIMGNFVHTLISNRLLLFINWPSDWFGFAYMDVIILDKFWSTYWLLKANFREFDISNWSLLFELKQPPSIGADMQKRISQESFESRILSQITTKFHTNIKDLQSQHKCFPLWSSANQWKHIYKGLVPWCAFNELGYIESDLWNIFVEIVKYRLANKITIQK